MIVERPTRLHPLSSNKVRRRQLLVRLSGCRVFVSAVAVAPELWHRGETKDGRHYHSARLVSGIRATEVVYTVEQPRPGQCAQEALTCYLVPLALVDFLEINLSSTGQGDRVASYYYSGWGSTSTMDEVSLHFLRDRATLAAEKRADALG